MPTGKGGGSSSLYDQYARGTNRSASPPSRAPRRAKSHRGHQTTRSAQLRAGGMRLCCYLNMEVDNGRSVIVQLPVDCDTLSEVIPKIQQRMQLDRRMMYIAELYLPTGDLITSMEQLKSAAKVDSPIIVGCGEPFDPLRVPNDMLEIHLNGGGRKAVKNVTREMRDKRVQEQHERAEHVRQAGHGVNSEAATVAREHHVEAMREQANLMRVRYMEGQAYSAQQQNELLQSVYSSVATHKLEAEASRQARNEHERERRERIQLDKQLAADEIKAARDEALALAQQQHDAIKYHERSEDAMWD